MLTTSSQKAMIAFANSDFSNDELRYKEQYELMQIKRELTDCATMVNERIQLIQRALRKKEDRYDAHSHVGGHPDQAIESLELPPEVEAVIGRKGIGVRTIDQLITYSRDFLADQLAQYQDRTVGIMAPRVDDIGDALDYVESQLALKGLKLVV